MDLNSSSAAKASGSPNAKWYFAFLILYLVLLSAFGSFVNDMYLPTLPEMMHGFHCSVSTVQLGLTMGMVGLGAGEVVLGPLSDRFGRKPILVAALVIFTVGAVMSVFSPSIRVFLWWRLVQGIGASGGYFLARTIPADMYSGRQLAKVMALVGGINGFAPASAPVIGGLVAGSVGWHGIFWILAAFSVLLLLLAPLLKESLPVSRRVTGRFGTAFRNYGILCRKRNFMIHVLLKGSALGLLFAYISSAPFIIQSHYRFSEIWFGVIMGVNSLFAAAGAMSALKFKYLKRAARFAGRALVLIVAAQALCFFMLDDFWVYEVINLPMLFCLGMIFTVGNTLAMNEGRMHAGDASAVIGLSGYVFGAVVSPLVGLGDVMHSTAVTEFVLALVVLFFARLSVRLAPDPQQP